MLSWLERKGLLTNFGYKQYQKFQSNTDAAVITENMVVSKARNFLNKYYDEWYQKIGINLAIDPQYEEDVNSITDYWAKFGKNESKG